MPKNKQFSLLVTKGSTIIRNLTSQTLGKSVAVTALVAVIITSLPFVTHAETMDAANSDVKEVLVDGLTQTERAAKIDAYFAQYSLPMAGTGIYFVRAADENHIDWKFVAAKAMIESTGGKFMPKGSYNPFGWACYPGSKCVRFESYEQAINEVTANLAGNREKTAKFYKDKTLSQKMASYNKVNPKYQPLVFGIMDKIAKMNAPVVLAVK